jgi:hypothetical protein
MLLRSVIVGSNGFSSVYLRAFLICLFGFFVSSALVWADGGSISGTVKDPTGGVIMGAAITVRNLATGVEQTVKSNDVGFYAFAILPVGRYEIEASFQGFKPFKRTGLVIDVNTALQADVVMEMSGQSEQITVSDIAVHVETESSQMGEVLAEEKISAVPLNGRSFTDLLNLQPGVIPISSQQPNSVIMAGVSNTPPSGDLNPGNMSISGQRETSNGFIVNSSDVEEVLNMGTAVVPNLDSINEFRILTNNFDAEYGNYSGGQIVVVTKSGTNGFHGDAFEFLRNTALDAKNFFSPQRAKFDQNQFGGTLGGPIKPNNVFFFADYQGSRTTEGVETGKISVPSLLDRTGNLADVADSLKGTVNGQYWANQLSQKLNYGAGGVWPGEPYYTPGCVSSSQCVFPNAIIPKSAWSVPAQNLLQYIPKPNLTATDFYTSAFDEVIRDDKGAVRLDAGTRLGMLSGYYFLDDYTLNSPYPTGQGGANIPGFNAITSGRAQLLSVGVVTTLGTNSVNEFHFSYMRNANNIGQPQGGVGPSLASQGFVTSTGTQSIFALDPGIEGIENIVFNDFTLGVDITGLVMHNNTFQWGDNFSKVIGTHTIKFGGAFHYDQINDVPDATFNGTFSFTGFETGSDFADFLLGVPSSFTQSDGQAFYLRDKYAGFFGQDTWRVRSNLTLNYGLRWDVIFPWYEKYNQLQTLVPGEQSIVYPGAPRGLVFPGDPGISRGIAPVRYGNFSPRLGLAYAPKFQNRLLRTIFGEPGKTSVRAGYGMFYTAFEGLSAGIMYAVPPYGYTYVSRAPPLFSNPFITAASGTPNLQPYPLTFPSLNASAANPNTTLNWSSYLPVNGDPAFSPDNRVPYAEHYNLSIERQFGSNTLLSVSYVGSQAHRLLVVEEANPGNPALCLSVSQPSEVLSGTATCGPYAETGSFVTSSGQTINVRGPLGPNFGSDTYQKTVGNSAYNALEVNLRHSGAHTEFLAGYTYSKSLDLSSNLGEEVNPFDPQLTRAISAFDMKHNFVVSYKVDLPFWRIFQHPSRLTNDWSLSGTTRFSTGLPVTLYNNTDTSLLGTYANGVNNNLLDEPNFTPGPLDINNNPRNGAPAFNASLFSIPLLGQLGTSPRRFFYGPGINNFDLALLKTLNFAESKSLQIRLEAFNALNHAQFYGPGSVNGNINSPNFGQIVNAAAPRILQVGAKFYF